MEAGGVQPLDLLIRGNQYLAALVAAFFGARALVFDVVAGNARFHKAANQVAHLGVAAVPGIRIGDDEGAVIDFRGALALLFTHARPGKILVLIRHQQRPYDHLGLVRHLAQGIAGQICSLVFGSGAFGGGRPAAQVNSLDALALHGHRLAGGVGAKGGDRLASNKQFP